MVAEELGADGAPALPPLLGVGRRTDLGVEPEDAPLPVEQVEHIAHGLFRDRQRPQPRLALMPKLTLVLLAAAAAAAPAAAASRPVSGAALLAIDRQAGFRNYLPTR